MNKKINKLILLSIFILTLFFKVNTVNAFDDKLCPSDTELDDGQAIACTYDFFNGSAKGTLVFVNSKNHGVCATVAKQDFNKWGFGWLLHPITDPLIGIVNGVAGREMFQYSNTELKGKAAFDVKDSTISNAITNKQCPKIKMVEGYDMLTSKTDSVVYSDNTEASDENGCALSYIISFGSECAVNDGYDLKMLNPEAANTIIDNQKQSTGKCDETCMTKITNWAKKEGYDTNSKINDPCYLINTKLTNLLKSIFLLISVVGIILLVAMTSISFVKAIVASDDNKIKDAAKGLKTRIIVIIILLVLPVLLSFIINVVNSNSTGKIKIGSDGKVFCDVTK
ncbi:MAG: hypothetical protein PUA73_01760 [Bacilli bacterium]|nr:hypothetical protein [Bacilli bacterium]